MPKPLHVPCSCLPLLLDHDPLKQASSPVHCHMFAVKPCLFFSSFKDIAICLARSITQLFSSRWTSPSPFLSSSSSCCFFPSLSQLWSCVLATTPAGVAGLIAITVWLVLDTLFYCDVIWSLQSVGLLIKQRERKRMKYGGWVWFWRVCLVWWLQDVWAELLPPPGEGPEDHAVRLRHADEGWEDRRDRHWPWEPLPVTLRGLLWPAAVVLHVSQATLTLGFGSHTYFIFFFCYCETTLIHSNPANSPLVWSVCEYACVLHLCVCVCVCMCLCVRHTHCGGRLCQL